MNNTLEKWEEKTLEDLCEIEIGKTPNRSTPKFWDKELITDNTWLSIADLNNTLNKAVSTSKERISDIGASNIKIVKQGTLLLSFKLTIGRVAFAGKNLYTNEAIAQLPIKNPKEIDKNYLYYYLQYFNYDKLLRGDVKVKGKALNKEKLKALPVLYPELSEQQRIVGILDEAFENIEKAKQNALQNLNNAKELFENTLENLFTLNTENWIEKKLSDLGDICTGTTPKTSEKDNFGDFIPFIKPADFNKDGSLVYDNEGLSEKGLKKARFIPKNSVLMVCIGATITKTGYTIMDITCNQQINALSPQKDNYKFIYYAMIKNSFKEFILSGCPQTTLPIINKTNWSALTIKLPNILEQQKIVAQLDELQEQTKKLQQIYEQKIKDLDELKQSILQKAFNGEL